MKATRFETKGYEILDYAARELKSKEPEYVTVLGHIRALTSSDNPLSAGSRRAVVVRGTYTGFHRPVDIVVELTRDDYARANQAHIDWSQVHVSGVITRSGTAWRLLDAHDFRVLER